MKRPTSLELALLAPAGAIILLLMMAPIILMTVESFRPFVGGRAGAQAGWTTDNYTELFSSAYAHYYWDTFRIGFIVAFAAVLFGSPLAYVAARTKRPAVRLAIFGLLIGLLFMSLIARLYAVQMTWGATGPLAFVGALIGVPVRSPRYAEVQVIVGLLTFVLPIIALMLIGTFQNINPRLEDAAASLGAPRWRVALDVTFPLAWPGLVTALTIGLAMCISNFVVPLILGRGIVLFTTNLMYTRFSDVANYPSGAAIGLIMMVLAIGIINGMLMLSRRLWPVERAS